VSVGRARVRAIGIALAAAGAVVSLQACGSGAVTVVPAASPAATGPGSAALATTPDAATPDGTAPADDASATPTAKPVVTTSPKPAAPKLLTQAAVRAQPLVEGTPCTASAKACVDLDSQRAWLFDGKGKIVRGPVEVASGGKTEPTPPGYDMRVYLKDIDHVSNESFTDGKPDPMPYSVFFETGGIAFHEGDPENPSGGCVHLTADDAKAWYAAMKMGDSVQVVHASEELPAHGEKYSGPMYGAGGVKQWLKEHGDDD
jgi:lipoprotein-anchoring transpeptidase ErfK/SrfK